MHLNCTWTKNECGLWVNEHANTGICYDLREPMNDHTYVRSRVKRFLSVVVFLWNRYVQKRNGHVFKENIPNGHLLFSQNIFKGHLLFKKNIPNGHLLFKENILNGRLLFKQISWIVTCYYKKISWMVTCYFQKKCI